MSIWETSRSVARALRRRPGFAATVIVCWTLGMTVHGATAYLADSFFLRPPAHVKDPARVFRIYATVVRQDAAPATASRFTYSHFSALQRTLQPEATIAALGFAEMAGSVNAYYATLKVAAVSANYFATLGVTPAKGRLFGVGDSEHSGLSNAGAVVVSSRLWETLKADSALAIGQNLRLSGRSFTVVGIVPSEFTGGEVDRIDAWILLDADGDLIGGTNWRTSTRWWLSLLGREQPHVTTRRLEVKSEFIISRLAKDGDARVRNVTVRVAPILPSRGPIRSLAARAAALLALASLAFLLLATVNVAGMLVLRGVSREREFAIKHMLGARNAVLVSEAFGEIAALSFGVAATSLVLVSVFKEGISRALLSNGALDGRIVDWRLLSYTSFVCAGTAILVGALVWMVRADRYLSVSATTLRVAGAKRLKTMQTAILCLQSAAATALLSCASLVMVNLFALRSLDLGVRVDRVLLASVTLPYGHPGRMSAQAFMQDLRERVLAVPGVAVASIAVAAPFMSSVGVAVNSPDHAALYETAAGMPLFNAVSSDYFDAVGMRIVRGTRFDRQSVGQHNYVAVVNETFARLAWPRGDYAGHCLILGADASNPCYRVVGVAADARRFTIIPEEPAMQVYVPVEQNIFSGVYPALSLVVRADQNVDAVSRQVARLARGVIPADAEISVHLLEELVDPQMRPWRIGGPVFASVGGMALVLTMVGVFGAVAYAAQQRKREIGIRMALGATLPLIIRDVGAPTFAASVFGVIAGGWICTGLAIRYSDLLLPDVARHAIGIVLLSMTLVIAVLLVAGILPILNAARSAVAAALQAE